MGKKSFNRAEKYERGIAKINIDGLISSITRPRQLFSGPSCYPDKIIREIDLAEEDYKIKGIIIPINSQGGYPVACCEIADRISSIKKPNVALIRDIAASGGYLVASASPLIIAYEMSQIGSIGVLSPRFEYTKIMEKFGVEYKPVKAGKYKDLGVPFKPLSPEEKEKLQNLVDQTYNSFIKIIVKNRNLSEEKVKDIADGFILLGEEAKKLGLIDEIGNLETAIEFCEKKGNFKHDKLVKRRESLSQRISGMFG